MASATLQASGAVQASEIFGFGMWTWLGLHVWAITSGFGFGCFCLKMSGLGLKRASDTLAKPCNTLSRPRNF